MKKIIRYGLALLTLFIVYYIIPVNSRLLWQPDETRYAEISREMLLSGEWVVPHFLGLRYFEKPIAGYWINSIGQWLFGDTNFAVRAGAIFSTGLTLLLVIWLAWQLWHNKRVALLSGIIFLTMFLVFSVGTYAVLDPIVTLWLVAAMCCFWGASQAQTTTGRICGYLLLGFACGMGVMTKGFLALAVPVIGILPWVSVQKRWKEVLLFGWMALLGAVFIVLPWGLAIAHREPDFWRYFFWVEHIQRFVLSNAQHKAPIWYYLPIIIAGSLPWLALLPGAIFLGWRDRGGNAAGLYVLGWVVMPFLFFSIGKGKLLTYILPCLPPLSILMAHYACIAAKRGARILRVNGGVNVAFGLFGVVVVLWGSPWGLTTFSIWAPTEKFKFLCAIISFLFWSIMGCYAMLKSWSKWWVSALCPAGLILLIGFAIPDRIIYSKQPQLMVNMVREQLQGSTFVVADNVGIASGLAWALKRNDIIMYSQAGELSYGLNYPDVQGRFVPKSDISSWLESHRLYGDISLVILQSASEEHGFEGLPEPDEITIEGDLIYMHYLQR